MSSNIGYMELERRKTRRVIVWCCRIMALIIVLLAIGNLNNIKHATGTALDELWAEPLGPPVPLAIYHGANVPNAKAIDHQIKIAMGTGR